MNLLRRLLGCLDIEITVSERKASPGLRAAVDRAVRIADRTARLAADLQSIETAVPTPIQETRNIKVADTTNNPPLTEQQEVDRLTAALGIIDTATTAAGTATTAIQARQEADAKTIRDLQAQLAAAGSTDPAILASLDALAGRAETNAAALQTLSATLTQMGTDPGNVVPTNPQPPLEP